MHELAVCQALIDQVTRVARDNGAGSVLSITISVGPLAGVEPKLLEHAYPLAAAGTVAQDAQLVIETVAVRVRCRKCQAETTVLPNRLLCGTCNDWQVDVIAGDEMLLQRVEIEPAPELASEPVH
jgi:hydrogenase nickel incorporation protein HypA/HybF